MLMTTSLALSLPGDVETRLKNLAAMTERSEIYHLTKAVCEYTWTIWGTCVWLSSV
jgi:predicted transcriptional regulator